MIKRLGKLCFCVLVGFAVGVVSYIAVEIAHSPSILSHPLRIMATTGAVFYVAIPLAVLALLAIFRPTPSIVLSILVCDSARKATSAAAG